MEPHILGTHHGKLYVLTNTIPTHVSTLRTGAGAKKAKKAAGKGGKKGGRKGRRAAAADSDDDEIEVEVDGEEEEGAAQEGAEGGEGGEGQEEVVVEQGVEIVQEVVGVLPSRIRVDLAPICGLAHRRLRDDKAPVRKAAISVLESVLLLRGQLAAPAGAPPGPEDIAAVEAATADALVGGGLGIGALGGWLDAWAAWLCTWMCTVWFGHVWYGVWGASGLDFVWFMWCVRGLICGAAGL